MKDFKLMDGKRILIIEHGDINTKDMAHSGNIQKLFLTCRVKFDVVVVLTSTRSGRRVLPRYMRDSPLKPHDGQLTSCWIMEKDERERWV